MPKEIGWSVESNLLYQIKQLIRLVGSRSSQQTFVNYASFPVPGNTGVTYIDGSTGVSYIWNGSSYVPTVSLTAPKFPIVTSNGKIAGTSYIFAPVFSPTYLSRLVIIPALGKTYPDVTKPYNCFSTFPVFGGISSFDPSATAFSVSNFEAVSGATSITTVSGVTSITFADLKYLLGGVNLSTPSSIATLTTLSFPELIFIDSGITYSSGCPITSINLPKVEAINGNLTNQSTVITTINLPELLFISGFNDSVNSAVTSYSFPKLKIVGGSFTISGTKASLTSISFGALEYYNSSIFTMPTVSTSLTSFSFANTLKGFNANFVTTSNSLNQASVDNILIRLAALDGTGGTIAYSSKTVTITGGAATPSAAGLAAKAILVARGCTVTNN
jgi:hypothetical protein